MTPKEERGSVVDRRSPSPTAPNDTRGGRLVSNVAFNVSAAALLTFVSVGAGMLVDPIGSAILRGILRFAIASVSIWQICEITLAIRSNRAWTHGARFRKLNRGRRPLWRGMRRRYNRLLIIQLGWTVPGALTSLGLTFVRDTVFVPAVTTTVGLACFIYFRHQRDRMKRALGAPPIITWLRSGRTQSTPSGAIAWLINPRRHAGAPRSVWAVLGFFIAALPISFALYGGDQEVEALVRDTVALLRGSPAEVEGVTEPTPSKDAAELPEVSIASLATSSEWVVEEGDSFWSIAATHVRSARRGPVSLADVYSYWELLVATNEGILVEESNPDLIRPGQVLKLPPLDLSRTKR